MLITPCNLKCIQNFTAEVKQRGFFSLAVLNATSNLILFPEKYTG